MEKPFFLFYLLLSFTFRFPTIFFYNEVRQVTDRNKCNAKDSCLQRKTVRINNEAVILGANSLASMMLFFLGLLLTFLHLLFCSIFRLTFSQKTV
jgi:hypothetical protein